MSFLTELCHNLMACYGPVVGTAFTIWVAALPMFVLINLLVLPILLNKRLDPYFINNPSLAAADLLFQFGRPIPSYARRATTYMLAVIFKNGTRTGFLGKELITARQFLPGWIVGICFASYAWMGMVFGALILMGCYFVTIHMHDKWLGLQPRWQLQCDIDQHVSLFAPFLRHHTDKMKDAGEQDFRRFGRSEEPGHVHSVLDGTSIGVCLVP